MTLLGGWLLGPLALALLCSGIGLLAERLARRRLPGALVPGVGLAGLIALAGLFTLLPATAPLAAPACALVAVIGLVLGRRRISPGFWPVLCAVMAFAVVAAPSLLSGQGSILGWMKLNDSAVWAGFADRLLTHARDLGSLEPSSYRLNLERWLGTGYPAGAFTPVGVVARLTHQDVVNVYQPVIGGYVAITALGFCACARELAASPRRGAVIGVIAVQASLFYGYVAWGSIKEVCVVALLATLAALRSAALVLVVAVAVLAVFGVGGLVLAGPPAVVVLAAGARRRPWRLRSVIIAGALLGVALLPVLILLSGDVEQLVHGAPSAQGELGTLNGPLNLLQGAGLWPLGDFRDDPSHPQLFALLAVACLALAAAGVAVAVRRRTWGLPALAAAALVGGGIAIARGAPWIDAKVLAMASALLLACAAAFLSTASRAVATAGLAILAFGAGTSTALVFRDVQVAPRRTLAEQRALGHRLAGHGRTLVLDYAPYATRLYFADARPEAARELQTMPIPDRAGGTGPQFTPLEMDDVAPRVFGSFNAIVRRATPVGSLPPVTFKRFASTRSFESWVRVPGSKAPLADLPLAGSDPLYPALRLPAAAPDCDAVAGLARTAGARALIAAERPNPVLGDLAQAKLPAGWLQFPVRPITTGTATLQLDVPSEGTWRGWILGTPPGALSMRLDGRPLGRYRHEIDLPGAWLRFGATHLDPGPHTLSVHYERGPFWWAGRGSDEAQPPLGPVALTLEGAGSLRRVSPAHAQSLCDGRTFDWIEALG